MRAIFNLTSPKKKKRSYGEGANTGLTVLLNAEVKDYAFASSSFIGFKVR